MTFTLYIAENCHQCPQVAQWVKDNTQVPILNVDTDGAKPPIPTFIFPALFQNEGLKAYGEDIIPILKRNLDVA
jgi:hypothetical protein